MSDDEYEYVTTCFCIKTKRKKAYSVSSTTNVNFTASPPSPAVNTNTNITRPPPRPSPVPQTRTQDNTYVSSQTSPTVPSRIPAKTPPPPSSPPVKRAPPPSSPPPQDRREENYSPPVKAMTQRKPIPTPNSNYNTSHTSPSPLSNSPPPSRPEAKQPPVKKIPPATVRGGEKLDMMKSQPIQRKSPMNEAPKQKTEKNDRSNTSVDPPTISKKTLQPPSLEKRHSKLEVEEMDRSTAALDLEGIEKKSAKGVGDAWSKNIQAKKASEFENERDKIQGRVDGGVKFMDTQIRKMIDYIKKISEGRGSGIATVSFGRLFEATSDDMPALAATLAVAKKRKVVDYEGIMLMQGTHDYEIITLLKDKIEDTKVYEISRKPPPTEEKGSLDQGAVPCQICGKTAYTSERVVANKWIMHKNCFRCTVCSKVLKLQSYALGNNKFYCEPHFKELYNKKGGDYNF